MELSWKLCKVLTRISSLQEVRIIFFINTYLYRAYKVGIRKRLVKIGLQFARVVEWKNLSYK